MHPLINIITITLCAVICGSDDFVSIAAWGREKREWLAKFLDMSHGVPSHDRFNAVLARLKPAEFEQCLLNWITSMHEIAPGQVIAIDGKTLRRSFDAASGKAAIHMVSAWATANKISLGQVVVDAKSNEITAIPQLLQMLEISGALITIDAMGCQTEIAKQIVVAKANYVLDVKLNQPTLHDGIAAFFNDHLEDDFARIKVGRHRTHEKRHGREETRQYFICAVPCDLPDAKRWKNLKAIGMAISYTVRDGKPHHHVRYYILSKRLSGRRFAEAVRGHWSIENQLHWQLDVSFQEDQSRLRRGHADTNFSIVRRAALGLLKNNTSRKLGIKNKRLTAGWSESYLEELLFGT